jgi:hypothetical protein
MTAYVYDFELIFRETRVDKSLPLGRSAKAR